MNYIDNFKVSEIACKIAIDHFDLNNAPLLSWDFNSLKLAIDTIFALNATNTRKLVKMCKHCGKPFYSTNIKAEYCCPQCRNQANVYKSRAKNIC